MKVVVNGKSCEYKGRLNVTRLLAQMGAFPGRVAVVVNGGVVSRNVHGSKFLKNGDMVEILTYAGGG